MRTFAYVCIAAGTAAIFGVPYIDSVVFLFFIVMNISYLLFYDEIKEKNESN